MKIRIALATYNRPIITDICLNNLSTFRSTDVELIIYDDASTAYDQAYLESYSDKVIRFPTTSGITQSRTRALRDFLDTEYDLLYLTDNDTVHDPNFLNIIRESFILNDQYPLSLYNTHWHRNNLVDEDDRYYYSKRIPGISHCYTREIAKEIVDKFYENPDLTHSYGWDDNFISAIGRTCRFTKISYVEHFARDRYEGGMHARVTGTGIESRIDFERDRASNPTPYLQLIRQQVIDYILGP